MNRTLGVLLLTTTLTLFGCSDPTGTEVVGEVIFAQLTSPGGTLMGDGVIFPDTEPIDFPGIVLKQEGEAIEVRGAGIAPCGCTVIGVVELHGKNQLTVSITTRLGGNDLPWPFAFRATTSDLEPGFYEVRVIYDETSGHREPTVVFTDTAVID